MKKTFDVEASRWLINQETIDYNIQPPGYSSVEMTKYMIEELTYYKIIHKEDIIGGVIVTITGKSFGRIDRIFIDPDYQGMKIGTRVMEFIEQEYSTVRTWDLETSSRQLNNHYFYEKIGYKNTFKTADEYSYIKEKRNSSEEEAIIEDYDLSNNQYTKCIMENTECYQVNLSNSSFSNSTLMSSQFSNCNLSHSKFQNINFKNSLFADLNLSHSKMRLVTLSGVKFLDTTLGDAKEPLSFERCELQETKIINSNLVNVQIMDCDVKGMTINHIPVEKLLELYEREMNKEPK